MNITVFQADSPADVLSLVRRSVIYMQSLGIDQWDEIYPDRSVFERDIALKSLFAGWCDGNLAGIIVLNENQDEEYQSVPWVYPGKTLVVHRLCVALEYQGRGIASQLMQFAECHARENGYQNIRLDAFVKNPMALRLYERLGYRRAGMVQFRKGEFICFEKEVIR